MARHRTVLALIVAALVVARITAEELGILAFGVTVAVPVLLVCLWRSGRPSASFAVFATAVSVAVMMVSVFEIGAMVG